MTSEKYPPPTFAPPVMVSGTPTPGDTHAPALAHVPAHKDFRVKYFHGFKKEPQEDAGETA